MGSLQMGSHGYEKQVVQSGTWDGDNTILALASPASSPCEQQREAMWYGGPQMLLRKIA